MAALMVAMFEQLMRFLPEVVGICWVVVKMGPLHKSWEMHVGVRMTKRAFMTMISGRLVNKQVPRLRGPAKVVPELC